MKSCTLVFVHGWSVTHTDTYGSLPRRLQVESRESDLNLSVQHVYLGRYVSFQNEVRMEDLSKAFQAALERDVLPGLKKGERFACIAHSTGGPLARDWFQRFYTRSDGTAKRCPMSHLIMLAPANAGSALASMGRGRLGRIRAFLDLLEPGQGVLDWLALGSPDAFEMNRSGLHHHDKWTGGNGFYPFVLTGQSIDHALYDHVNPYTDEMGSDGVVRVASANMNSRYLSIRQTSRALAEDRYECDYLRQLTRDAGAAGGWIPTALSLSPMRMRQVSGLATRILANCSHSGEKTGIMAGVGVRRGAKRGKQTVAAILSCLAVTDRRSYERLAKRFDAESREVQMQESVDVFNRGALPARVVPKDRCAMLVIRVSDSSGHPVEDVDVLLTAGKNGNPNHLPPGFLVSKQVNRHHPGSITFYFNYDVMAGCDELLYKGRLIRGASPGAGGLGLIVLPRPLEGFVHYQAAVLSSSLSNFKALLSPNQTTWVDLTLRRVVHRGVFEADHGTRTKDFSRQKPGEALE